MYVLGFMTKPMWLVDLIIVLVYSLGSLESLDFLFVLENLMANSFTVLPPIASH